MAPILINKYVFEPSYNDLKFRVWNHNYFSLNLIHIKILQIFLKECFVNEVLFPRDLHKHVVKQRNTSKNKQPNQK